MSSLLVYRLREGTLAGPSSGLAYSELQGPVVCGQQSYSIYVLGRALLRVSLSAYNGTVVLWTQIEAVRTAARDGTCTETTLQYPLVQAKRCVVLTS